MDGVEEKQRPHPLVEVIAAAPQLVERFALGQELVEGSRPGEPVERAIAGRRVGGGDDFGELAHG